MKEFKLKRKVLASQADAMKAIDPEMGSILAKHLQGALPAITLTAHSSLTTAFMNDSEPVLVFAQQVNGYGKTNYNSLQMFVFMYPRQKHIKFKSCTCLFIILFV